MAFAPCSPLTFHQVLRNSEQMCKSQEGQEVWLLPTDSPFSHSVCVSSGKAVLPGDPDYIQLLTDYMHRPALSPLF